MLRAVIKARWLLVGRLRDVFTFMMTARVQSVIANPVKHLVDCFCFTTGTICAPGLHSQSRYYLIMKRWHGRIEMSNPVAHRRPLQAWVARKPLNWGPRFSAGWNCDMVRISTLIFNCINDYVTSVCTFIVAMATASNAFQAHPSHIICSQFYCSAA